MDGSDISYTLQTLWDALKSQSPSLLTGVVLVIGFLCYVAKMVLPKEIGGALARRRDMKDKLIFLDGMTADQQKVMRKLVEAKAYTAKVLKYDNAAQELIERGVLQPLSGGDLRDPFNLKVAVTSDYLAAFDKWAKSQR